MVLYLFPAMYYGALLKMVILGYNMNSPNIQDVHGANIF